MCDFLSVLIEKCELHFFRDLKIKITIMRNLLLCAISFRSRPINTKSNSESEI